MKRIAILAIALVLALGLVPAANVGAASSSYTLLETLSVPAEDIPPVTSTVTLLSGRNYRFEASGTYRANGSYEADAEYCTIDGWVNYSDDVPGYTQHGEGLLELKIDGSIVEWGAYNSSHVYTLDYAGTGSTVQFQIYDLGGGTNNSGALAVKIYVANKVIYVPTDYATIQAAVNAALPGDTIKVRGGPYTEQVTITTSNLMLRGMGSPTITVPAETAGSIIHVWGATDVSIVGFEIDGAWHGLSTSPGTGGPATDKRFYGIRYSNASGTVRNNKVHGIEHPIGCKGYQSGVAIYAYASNVGIHGNTVYDYQKCGIVASLPGSSQIHGNTVTGWGPHNVIAQNGIQVGFGATASVKKNTVEDNWYIPTSWTAAGVLIFAADNVRVANNTIRNNEIGVDIETYTPLPSWWSPAYGDGSVDNNKVIRNKFRNNGTDIDDGGTATKAHANVP